jgi:nitroimidazol reductase NimA-like FMN-containing flavoprotein (pyridoxamine 5'-phosphate oxidase superfamily)
MSGEQHLELLQDPVAEKLLASSIPARLAYTWTDGTPRVVPIVFHWNGSVFAFGTQPHAPKVAALEARPEVAFTIDDTTFPYAVLLVRGTAVVTQHDDMTPEYREAVPRYLGAEAGAAWIEQMSGQPMAKITVTPREVRILDFVTRFPSAMSA